MKLLAILVVAVLLLALVVRWACNSFYRGIDAGLDALVQDFQTPDEPTIRNDENSET